MSMLSNHWFAATTAISCTLAVSIITPAQAFSIAGTSTASWGLPATPSASTTLSNVNGGVNNRLTWGNPTINSFSNYVQFDGTSINATTGSQFKIGDLTYRNGATTDNFDGDFPLVVTLVLSAPTSISQNFNFGFNILNTPNSTNNPVLDGDRLRFATAGLASQSFSFNGVNYTLALTGFSNDGGLSFVEEFNSPEGSTASAGLYGQVIAAEAVPEPLTTTGLLLAGAGLLGARRRSKQQG